MNGCHLCYCPRKCYKNSWDFTCLLAYLLISLVHFVSVRPMYVTAWDPIIQNLHNNFRNSCLSLHWKVLILFCMKLSVWKFSSCILSCNIRIFQANCSKWKSVYMYRETGMHHNKSTEKTMSVLSLPKVPHCWNETRRSRFFLPLIYFKTIVNSEIFF